MDSTDLYKQRATHKQSNNAHTQVECTSQKSTVVMPLDGKDYSDVAAVIRNSRCVKHETNAHTGGVHVSKINCADAP